MRHRLMILCFIIFVLFILYGQRISISGNVKDKNGDPLIGVTVQVKGTNSGTITDFDGNYLLLMYPKSRFWHSLILEW